MCRRNRIWWCCSICAGLGILAGCSLITGFWGCVIGVVLVVLGLLNLPNKQA